MRSRKELVINRAYIVIIIKQRKIDNEHRSVLFGCQIRIISPGVTPGPGVDLSYFYTTNKRDRV